MKDRARPVEAALAALASIGVALPLLELFDSNDWVAPAIGLVAVVALSGIGLRCLVRSALIVISAQVLVLLVAACWLFARPVLAFGVVPTPRTFAHLGELLSQAGQAVVSYAAPVPTTTGVVAALGIGVGLTAVVTDSIAVTLRATAVAGLPLLAAYLISAANSGEGLQWTYFILPAASWFALLGYQGVGVVRRWATTVARADTTSTWEPVAATASTARILGVSALALAVIVPMAVPHLPTTFLADGLGRASQARGPGDVSLNTTLDLRRSLENPSLSPILSYSTQDADPSPLRVGVLDRYANGEWRDRDSRNQSRTSTPPTQVDPAVPQKEVTIEVKDSRLREPQVALPAPLVRARLDGQSLTVDGDGDFSVERAASDYAATYLNLTPAPADFTPDGSRPPGPTGRGNPTSLSGVNPDAALEIERIVADVVPEGSTPLQALRLLQDHFRSGDYAYSLDLPEPTDAANGDPNDPLLNFLRSKTGYCVQFATAYIVAARSMGLPARMAIGFLPGQSEGESEDGETTYTVRASDAHAWPEVWFPKLGWTRFEPTPGVRAGSAPTYSLLPTDDAPIPSTTPSPTGAAPTPTPTQRPEEDDTADQAVAAADTGFTAWLRDYAFVGIGVLVLVLAALVVPVGAWLSRRRARRAAHDEAERVEAEWALLISRLADIGVTPPSGATPREAARRLADDAVLSDEPRQAMTRVVSTLEHARYAPPNGRIRDVEADTRIVWRAALSSRRRPDRLRAWLLPGDGRRWWSRLRPRLPRQRKE